jgi:hypothetical protein
MAVPAQNGQNQSSLERRRAKKQLTAVEYTAVRLYAAGNRRQDIAKMLWEREFPDLEPSEGKKKMRLLLRRWEETQWFRDHVYDYSVGLTDMAVPRILKGVRQRAERGRVDAARLALEVTGRHNPRGEQSAPAVVHLNFGGVIPRPDSRADLELEPVEEEG